MSMIKKATGNNQNFTNQQFLALGQNLAGLETSGCEKNPDSWNAAKLINFSKSLGAAYGGDF